MDAPALFGQLEEPSLEKQGEVLPYQQETQHTCSAACLRAVLLHYGLDVPEKKLAELIGVTKNGAEVDQITSAAKKLGFHAYDKSLTVGEAKRLLKDGVPIICDIQSFTKPGTGHYVVLTSMDEDGVEWMDPNVKGNRRRLTHEEWASRWWDRAMKHPHEDMVRWGVVISPNEKTAEDGDRLPYLGAALGGTGLTSAGLHYALEGKPVPAGLLVGAGVPLQVVGGMGLTMPAHIRRQISKDIHDPRLYSNLRGMASLEDRKERVKAHKLLNRDKEYSILGAMREGLMRGDGSEDASLGKLAASIKKEKRRPWNVANVRSGRRPMSVDTMLKKEKDGTLGVKFAEAVKDLEAIEKTALTPGLLFGTGAVGHLATNVGGAAAHHGSNIADVLAHRGFQAGLTGSVMNPMAKFTAKSMVGPEALMSYEAAHALGKKLAPLHTDQQRQILQALQVSGHHPAIGHAPILGPVKNAIGHELAGTAPELQSKNMRAGLYGNLTEFLTRREDTPFDTTGRKVLNTAIAGAPLSIAAVEHGMLGHFALNQARELGGRTPYGKKIVQKSLEKGLEGETLHPAAEKFIDIAVSPGVLDPMRAGRALREAGAAPAAKKGLEFYKQNPELVSETMLHAGSLNPAELSPELASQLLGQASSLKSLDELPLSGKAKAQLSDVLSNVRADIKVRGSTRRRRPELVPDPFPSPQVVSDPFPSPRVVPDPFPSPQVVPDPFPSAKTVSEVSSPTALSVMPRSATPTQTVGPSLPTGTVVPPTAGSPGAAVLPAESVAPARSSAGSLLPYVGAGALVPAVGYGGYRLLKSPREEQGQEGQKLAQFYGPIVPFSDEQSLAAAPRGKKNPDNIPSRESIVASDVKREDGRANLVTEMAPGTNLYEVAATNQPQERTASVRFIPVEKLAVSNEWIQARMQGRINAPSPQAGIERAMNAVDKHLEIAGAVNPATASPAALASRNKRLVAVSAAGQRSASDTMKMMADKPLNINTAPKPAALSTKIGPITPGKALAGAAGVGLLAYGAHKLMSSPKPPPPAPAGSQFQQTGQKIAESYTVADLLMDKVSGFRDYILSDAAEKHTDLGGLGLMAASSIDKLKSQLQHPEDPEKGSLVGGTAGRTGMDLTGLGLMAAPTIARLATGAGDRFTNVANLAGLGALAVPTADNLQAAIRARRAGVDPEKKMLLGHKSHSALELAGLGTLAVPVARGGLKPASAATLAGYGTLAAPVVEDLVQHDENKKIFKGPGRSAAELAGLGLLAGGALSHGH